jgi:hypothetical protein
LNANAASSISGRQHGAWLARNCAAVNAFSVSRLVWTQQLEHRRGAAADAH